MLVFQQFVSAGNLALDDDTASPKGTMATERLSGRERQVMDILYRDGQATATEIMDGLRDAPSYSAVRALLRVLEEKGLVVRVGKSVRSVVYRPAQPRSQARRSAVRRLLNTFFGGSIEDAVSALLNARDYQLSDAEIERLGDLIKRSGKAEA